MIRKKEKHIDNSEDKALTLEGIEDYLSACKKAVEEGRYRIDRNARRQSNLRLFREYVMDEQKAKEILMSLTAYDFSEIVQNEHAGFEHEQLYIFGKDVPLLERFGSGQRVVSLYIKFNYLANHYVIVVSFHEQRYPLSYYFMMSG